MAIHVAIMSTNKNKIMELYEKATKIDFIEYVQIYPHRIHYASEIYYIKDEQFISILSNSKNTIDIKASNDIDSKTQLFDTLKARNVNHIFVRFDENMDNRSIFDVVRNISKILTLI